MKCLRHDPGKVCPECGLDRRQIVIAKCSCGASFYDHESSIDRMNNHINGTNYVVHRWIFVRQPEEFLCRDTE